MATTLAPFGMRPTFHPSGIIRPSTGTILNTYTTNIYMYDPVSIQTTGVINQTAAGASNGLIGVFLGCEYTLPNGRRTVSPYWPGSGGASTTDIVAYYTTDPSIVYEIQADASVTLANVGEQTQFSNIGNGSTASGVSGATLSVSNLSASTANQLRVVGINVGVDNVYGDTYTIVQVQISLHQYVNRQGPF